MTLIEISNLNVRLHSENQDLHVVRNLSLTINQGEIFGIVGESGSGKTMTCTTLLGLTPDKALVEADCLRLGDFDLRETPWSDIRGKEVAMIFQDPAAALNPVFTLGAQIDAVLKRHTALRRGQRKARVIELLESVGLPEPDRIRSAYPHQLSGGMQQRALIAMALSAGAKVLVADEPTTALDVTVQAQILKLLRDLRDQLELTILFVSHDLAVVSKICDRVAVMLNGEIVETGSVKDVLHAPKQTYTKALLGASPRKGSKGTDLPTIAAQMLEEETRRG